MPALLSEVTRGNIVESRHYGHVAVCDSKELAIMCASHYGIYGDSSGDNVAPGAWIWIIM